MLRNKRQLLILKKKTLLQKKNVKKIEKDIKKIVTGLEELKKYRKLSRGSKTIITKLVKKHIQNEEHITRQEAIKYKNERNRKIAIQKKKQLNEILNDLSYTRAEYFKLSNKYGKLTKIVDDVLNCDSGLDFELTKGKILKDCEELERY